MSKVTEIRERLRRAYSEPGEFQSHAVSDVTYLLDLLGRASAEIEALDEKLRLRLVGSFDLQKIEKRADGYYLKSAPRRDN